MLYKLLYYPETEEVLIMKLMLVEDDKQAMANLAQVLETVGFAVAAYSDPERAVENFDQSYSLVISDIKMPKLNGYEVLRRVKTINPGVRVILITAFANENDVAAALGNGAERVIFKPINVFELIHTITTLMKTE